MASSTLPSTPFNLTGGCFCKAIRYSISIPALDSRPLLPPAKFPYGTQSEDPEHPAKHGPLISYDHCNSCRHVAGSIIQPWFICPASWVSFTLVAKAPSSSDPSNSSKSEDQEISQPITPTTLDFLKPSADLRSKTYVSYFSSSKNVNRTFCGRCGTGLTFFRERDKDHEVSKTYGTVFDIVLGTLDDECLEMPGIKPNRQGHVGDGIGWVKAMLQEGERAFSV